MKTIPPSARFWRGLLPQSLWFALGGVAALASESVRTGVAPVWPPPPNEPRVVYVRSFSKPAEVGIKASAFKWLVKQVSGADAGEKKLVNPFGLALDEKGGLCITDTGARTVSYYDAAAGQWQQWTHAGPAGFLEPVAVAKRGKTLFVADSALAEVVVFDTDGTLRFEIKRDLGRPTGLALMGDRLFVTDVQRQCVSAFDLSGNRLFSFGKRGEGPGEFNYPTHAAADAAGHLLITDALNNRVQVFDADGRFQTQIGSAGDTSGHFGRPKGVAVDAFGHVYVADGIFDNIQVFDFSGRLLLNLGASGSGPGEFGLPNGIAIGADNQIYVADFLNHRVQVLRYVGQQ